MKLGKGLKDVGDDDQQLVWMKGRKSEEKDYNNRIVDRHINGNSDCCVCCYEPFFYEKSDFRLL